MRQVNKALYAGIGTIIPHIPRLYIGEIEDEVIKLNHIYKNPCTTARLSKSNARRLFNPTHKETYKWVQMFLENNMDIGAIKYTIYNGCRTVLDILLDDAFIFKDLLFEHASKITWTPCAIEIINHQLKFLNETAKLDREKAFFLNNPITEHTNKIILYEKFYTQLLSTIHKQQMDLVQNLQSLPLEIQKLIVWWQPEKEYPNAICCWTDQKSKIKSLRILRTTSKNMYAYVGTLLNTFSPEVPASEISIIDNVLYLNHIHENPITPSLAQKFCFFFLNSPKDHSRLQILLEHSVDIGTKKSNFANHGDVTILWELLTRQDTYIFKDLLIEYFDKTMYTPEDRQTLQTEWVKYNDLIKENPHEDRYFKQRDTFMALQNKIAERVLDQVLL